MLIKNISKSVSTFPHCLLFLLFRVQFSMLFIKLVQVHLNDAQNSHPASHGLRTGMCEASEWMLDGLIFQSVFFSVSIQA